MCACLINKKQVISLSLMQYATQRDEYSGCGKMETETQLRWHKSKTEKEQEVLSGHGHAECRDKMRRTLRVGSGREL
jgi:hypothetical protein